MELLSKSYFEKCFKKIFEGSVRGTIIGKVHSRKTHICRFIKENY